MNFEDYVSPEPMTGCWLWTGKLTMDGLPMFGKHRAQRLAFESEAGPIGDKRIVRARCGNRFCVNPRHVYMPATTEDDRVKCVVAGCCRKRRHGYGRFCRQHWAGAKPCICGCGKLAEGGEYIKGHRRKYMTEDRAIAASREKRKERLAYTETREGWLISKRGWFKGQLKRSYGIAVADFAWMWEHANHACEICRKPLDLDGHKNDNGPHVDHDHATGIVRGILCCGCNHGIGQLRDDAKLVRRAADYLERRSPKQGRLLGLA